MVMENSKKSKENTNNESVVNNSDVLQIQEDEIEKMVDQLAELELGKNVQFSINASNQASCNRTSKGRFSQINALIVLINPYTLDKLKFSDIEVDIQMYGRDSLIIDDKIYKTHEVHPGIHVFGITEEQRGKSDDM